MIGRGSGVLNHITSLPAPYGCGDLGPWAYRFADLLRKAHQRYWQILPVTAVSPQQGYSPYSGPSAYAANVMLISPELLAATGRIERDFLQDLGASGPGPADFARARLVRERLLRRAYGNFLRKDDDGGYKEFCRRQADWLDDFALFAVLKAKFGGSPWDRWPRAFRDRRPKTLARARADLAGALAETKFRQFLFYEQWHRLREHCRKQGIFLIGDLPFYLAHDSADVWLNPEIFALDREKRPAWVSGVAPELFNPRGQKWGHPVFRWEILKERKYDWWLRRLKHNLDLYDFLRLDHFQGFFRYWEIPAGRRSALHGREAAGPALDLFAALGRSFSLAPLIAEDLGNITADTRDAMRRFNLPGMKPLLFAFDASLPTNPYAPHNIEKNSIVYTGTHDCNTVKGWFAQEATTADRRRLERYLGKRVTAETAPREFIRLALASVADTAMIALPDLFSLGAEGRMNRPGRARGNWTWRFYPDDLTPALINRLADLTAFFGRA